MAEPDRAGRQAAWELHPQFVLRSTGFPFALLDRISFPLSSAAVDDVLDAEDAVAAAAEAAVKHLKDPEAVTDGRLRHKLWKSLSRRRPLPARESYAGQLSASDLELLDGYQRALDRLAAAGLTARARFDAELPSRRAALRELARDERFQEAVWLSSPQMYERGLRGHLVAGPDTPPGPRDGRTRSLERQLTGYLQRVAAKNETASFFGPINYGDFTGPGEERPLAGTVAGRHAYLAYWVVRALADRIAEDPAVRPHLRPRLSPLARPAADGSHVVLARTRTVPLAGPAAALLALVDGERTAAELAAAAGLPVAEAVAELDRLAARHVVVHTIDLPVTEPRALEALTALVGALPESCPARTPWLARLTRLRELQQDFAGAGFARRRELLERLEREAGELTGLDARRAGGQLYADRLVITEECLGDRDPLRLGPDVRALLTAELAPVLELLAAVAVDRHDELTATAREALGLGEGDRIPLPRYLAKPWPDEPATARAGRWQRAVEDRLAGHDPVVLDPAEIAVDPAPLAGRALVCSPDVMIVAPSLEAVRAGEFTLVLAESHDTVLLWGWALQFLADPQAAQDAGAALLARLDTDRPLANMLTSKRAKIVPFEFPGPTVEAAQRSHRTDGATIPVGEVDVVVHDGRLELSAPGHPELLLHNGELESPAHNVLAPPRVRPVVFGGPGPGHTPRITVGRTVLQRERWSIARAELVPVPTKADTAQDTAFAQLTAVRRAAREHGLPRWVFAKIPGERKPVLLDTRGLFLAELVAHLSSSAERLTLSEMLPGPEDLWFDGPAGAHCSELRLSAARVWPPADRAREER